MINIWKSYFFKMCPRSLVYTECTILTCSYPISGISETREKMGLYKEWTPGCTDNVLVSGFASMIIYMARVFQL